ncbi:MAG TPA: hypothetical protein VK158_04565, partial [Acidobacteriota bacterium]|nr:hypothetical protein [Acidobacteriota bacterium]
MPKKKEDAQDAQETTTVISQAEDLDMQKNVNDANMLVPTDTYLKTGIHVGTKFKTTQMSPFIYKTRSDGLSVLNVQKIDERARLSFNLLKHYAPSEILVVCRRENGWKPLQFLQKLTGM